MRIKSLGLAAVFFLTLSVCGSTHAQVAGHIESMKLLTTDTGWAATRNKLFWTTDGGASWKDITPNTARGRTIHLRRFRINPMAGCCSLIGVGTTRRRGLVNHSSNWLGRRTQVLAGLSRN
jgi:hypothetical protein